MDEWVPKENLLPNKQIANQSILRDRLALVGAALLVCVVGVGMFLVASFYRIDTKWVVIALNSVGFIAIVWNRFKSFSLTPSVGLFFMIWLVMHGFFAFYLSSRISILYWVPIYVLEYAVGFKIADALFRPKNHPPVLSTPD